MIGLLHVQYLLKSSTLIDAEAQTLCHAVAANYL